jgi:hypothetical protein
MRTAKRSIYLGLFLIALATVAYEILLTRIFSVIMWYHFAFVAISVAMFGISVGAILVYVFPQFFRDEKTEYHLVQSSLLFSSTTILSFLYHAHIPFVDSLSFSGAISLASTYVVTALPFVFGGIVVCLALTRFTRHSGKLYAADLIGAAIGCLVPIGLLKYADAPTSIFVIAMITALGGFCFAGKNFNSARRSAIYSIAVLVVIIMANRAMDGDLLRLQYVKGARQEPLLFEKWNHFSRITVVDQPLSSSPMGWGLSPRFKARHTPQKELMLWMDSPAAATPITNYAGNLDNFDHLRYDIINMAHYLRQNAKVLVIGAGGGRDVLSALKFNQKSVLAVDINKDILNTVNGVFGDFSGHLDRDPRVRFVNDEARSYVARDPASYDIIQVSLIDTFAASAAGAFVLTENSLYTREAWAIFLSKLSNNGILTFSRWYFRNRPAEVYRLTALATQSLLDSGIESPRSHLILVRKNAELGIGTILISKRPFSQDEIQAVKKICSDLGFEIMLAPGHDREHLLAEIAEGKNLGSVVAKYRLNITPPTDNSPFFFNMLRFADVFHPELSNIGNMSQNTRAVFTLACLAVVVILLTAGCIIAPLALMSEQTALRGSAPMFVYFGAIGLGFMLVEVSQMQRLVVFLGHPTYALSVVLFSLLIFSGIGSYSTRWVLKLNDSQMRFTALLLSLVLFGGITPAVTHQLQTLTTPVRILVSIALLAPIGFFMGMAFPLGMRFASQSSARLTPWLWAINGATSVCASVFAIVIAISFGIHAAFWTGVAAYIVAALAYMAASLRTKTDIHEAERSQSDVHLEVEDAVAVH